MIGFSEETDLVRGLYRACEAGFGPVLHHLARHLRAESAELILPWADSGRHALGPPLALPAPDILANLREGRVYAQGDPPGTSPQDPALRLLRVAGPAILAVGRRQGDFRAADTAMLSRLGPHLETALTLWQRREAERADTRRDRAVARALGGAWLLVDAALKVESVGHDAAALALRAGITIAADGFLTLPDPESGRALRRAVDAVLIGAPARRVVLSMAPQVEAAVLPERTRALLCLRVAPDLPALPLLAAALGLTRSEARLVAALADGATLAEAAVALGWSVETARSTSKQVFSKLNVSGQPELLRRVLNGALFLMQIESPPFERR